MFARLSLVLILLAALVGGLSFLKYTQIQKQMAQFSTPMPPPTVSAATVVAKTWEPTLSAVGTVKAVQGVSVNNEVAGQVKSILFASGAEVEKGTLLVQLDDDVDRADLEGLVAAERLAEIKLKRNTSLLRDRAVAQGDVDETTAQLDQARALVKAKQAVIDQKQIRAPFAGQLGIRQIDLGQYLAEGSTIVSLVALDVVYVDYALPERDLPQLVLGQSVRIQVAAQPDHVFTGRIEAISPSLDKMTRNVSIRARFDNPEHLLRPGMFARTTTVLPAEKRTLVIPRQAVTFNTYGDSVFLIQDTDGKPKVQRRQIRTGAVRDDEVVILDGLAEGDRVVSAGQVKLTNGQEIAIQDETAPSAADQPQQP
ncbi:efflux RND transporter periplasmic adaptor subunit [Thiorhodococcus fuscus]|uniref:Efflux RND transporter periplasmic adaptor subunit n=1 Tax=Thiorhodococcus fuscus TaxID=527200 RepID=A0ABW4YBQ4_9GAMM